MKLSRERPPSHGASTSRSVRSARSATACTASASTRSHWSWVTLWRQGVTRDTLIDALLERLTDDYRHSLWPILTAPGSGRERLEAALRALCEVADRHLQLLLTSDTAFHEAQARARRRPSFIEPLVRLLHDGVADGSVREPPDYQDRANTLFNTVCWSYVHLRGKHGWSARRASSQVLPRWRSRSRTTPRRRSRGRWGSAPWSPCPR